VKALPARWATAKLCELVSPRGERVSPRVQADKQFIGLEHVEAHSTRILGSVNASEVKSSASAFRRGDVLYGRLRPYLNKVARPDFDGLASAEFMVFPDQAHLRSSFLKYRLNARDFVSFASRLNAGDRPRVDFDQIGGFEILLPPPSEQQRIANKLDELISDLDAGTAALKRTRENLKRYRAAVLKAAVEGRLTEKWRSDHPDVEPASKLLERILAERRKRWEEAQLRRYAEKRQSTPKEWREKYPEPISPVTADLPPLPKQWCWATLDQIAEIVGGITKGQKRANGSATRRVPYLRVANVQRGFLDLGEMKLIEATKEEIDELRLTRGDVLFNEGGDRDKLGRGWVWEEQLPECIHQNHVFRARLYSPHVQPKFVSIHGNTFGRMWFQRAGKQSVNLASINMGILKRFPVPLAPIEEQQVIVTAIEQELSVLDQSTTSVERETVRASVLRQSIFKSAFEGKLVPQDPNDEPASELLARLRGARTTSKGRPSKARARAVN